MLVSFVKIDDISTHDTSFYSVIFNDNASCEFELFDHLTFPDHKKEIQILYSIIDEIRLRGAKRFYFKPERGAHALPYVSQEIKKANKKDFGIRLYCIRLTDNAVILLNGNIKTKDNPLDCPNVRDHFRRAVRIAAKLDKLLQQKILDYENPDCLLEIELDI